MNNQLKITSLALICLAVAGCNFDADFDDPVGDSASYSKGDADFSNFVTIGDSLTAGYADGALYLAGQESSYPSILARQFAKVGGGSFAQPLVNDNLGGLLFNGVANPDFGNRLVLDASTKKPEPIAGAPTTEVIGSGLNGAAFNNMGVPGAKSFHLGSPDYGSAAGLSLGSANPYFVRFATASDRSMIADATAQQPSFFVMWVGNNDVLSYATGGGVGVDQLNNSDPASYGPDDITDPTAFTNVYNGLVGGFTTANPAAKGVLINIPNISNIPYFTTVPYNAVPLDQATADALNASYAAYNAGVETALGTSSPEAIKRTIQFSVGQNAVVIEDEKLTLIPGLPSIRQATAEDLLVLTSSSKIGTPTDPTDPASVVWGISAPLEDSDVLIPSEIQAIETARVAFNATIEAAADADPNILFYDVDSVMAELSTTGIAYGTGYVDDTYATGGGFSLDGVHPTARGYAVIANRILDTINEGFNANIPPVDPNSYSTIFIK